MKYLNIILLFILSFGMTEGIYGQCTNSFQWPIGNITASQYNDTTTVSPSQLPGDYFILENLATGKSYQFSSDDGSDYISIRDAYDPSILYAHGPSPLTYNVGTGPDIIGVHINLISPPCGSLPDDPANYRTSIVLCTSCDDIPPGVGIETSEPTATLDVNGNLRIGDSGRTPEAGTIRWNNDTEDFEGFNGTRWVSFTRSNVTNGWGTLPSNEANENDSFIASDGGAFDNFGASVSIDGDYAIIGAPKHTVNFNAFRGAAYVFHKTGTSWIQQAKLIATDGAVNDYFGTSVSINGDYAIVGAYLHNTNGNTDQGAAYLFHRNGDDWIQQAKLVAGNGAANEHFGTSVCIFEDYAIVGAPMHISGELRGGAYIYHRSGTTWTQQTQIEGVRYGERLGSSVAINETHAVVGSPNYYIADNDETGRVHIYQKSGSTWPEQTEIQITDSQHLGCSVSISNNFVILGSYGENSNQGAAYIFSLSGMSWTQQAKLTASDGAVSDRFGSSTSIDGDFAVVGAFLHDTGGNSNQGKAYIFYSTGSSWVQQSEFTATDGAVNDNFGNSVSIDGDYIIVGALAHSTNGNTSQGKSYIFNKN